MSDPLEVILQTEEEKQMAAIDLPENVMGTLLMHGAQFHQAHMSDITTNAGVTHNLARLIATRNFDEVGVLEGRSVSGVLATPIAGPTNAQKAP